MDADCIEDVDCEPRGSGKKKRPVSGIVDGRRDRTVVEDPFDQYDKDD